MYETENPAVRWLRGLLYVAIIGLVFQCLSSFLPPKLYTLSSYALSAVTLYLFFQLIARNSRYKMALLFTGITLVLALMNHPALAIAATICKYTGHFQEFYAHGELAARQDPKLGRQWNSLFWFHLAVELIGTMLVALLSEVYVTESGGFTAPAFISLATVVVSFLSVGWRIAYLVYLSRTIRVLKTEAGDASADRFDSPD